MRQIFLLAWRNLFRNTRRTAASLVTVAIGAGGLLIYQGFNEGIMNQYRENRIRVRFGHGQLFPKNYYDTRLEEPWKAWIENREAVEAKLLALPHVRNVFPRVSFYSFLVKGGVNLAGRGEGVISERENRFFTRMNFEEGGDLTAPDEIILGKGLAKALGAKPGDSITLLGQTVNGQINGVDLHVAGVFHTGSKEFDDTGFRIELATAQSLLDTKRIEHFAIETDGVEFWNEVKKASLASLADFEAISFDDLDAVYYKNSVDFLRAQFNFIRSILLLIVGLGIFNAIAVGLLERAGEVGALRANGESRRRIFQILSWESLFLGLLGGLVGIVVALALDKTAFRTGIPMPPGPGITRHYRILLEIQPSHFIHALILPTVTTLIASLLPISRLVRRPIPELLRQAH